VSRQRTPPPEPAAPARSRGHAHLAASARQALGIQGTVVQRVVNVPAPLFCAFVAAAGSVVAVLLRPQRAPRPLALPLDVAVVAVCVAAIVAHARVVELHTGEQARGRGSHAALLPLAALCALLVALAGSDSLATTVVGVIACAAVVALSAHLDGLRAAGREGSRERVLRDAAGSAVMVPVALAGASDALAAVPRAAVALLVAGLLTAGAVTPAPWRRALATGAGAGLAVGVATALAVHAGSQAAGAAGLLLLWYGLRGVAAVATSLHRDRLGLLEYGAVAAGAVALLVVEAHG
jgi:hypothetical protein